jgi:hypothetical protein
MRFTLSLTALACAFLFAAGSAHAAECVQMIYLDQNGAVIPTPSPVVAILVSGAPVVEERVPVHYSQKTGAPTPCHAKLVESIRAMFNASCPSEQSRNRAATENKVPVEAINQGCTNMLRALQAPAQ